jgi:hypothetical protein
VWGCIRSCDSSAAMEPLLLCAIVCTLAVVLGDVGIHPQLRELGVAAPDLWMTRYQQLAFRDIVSSEGEVDT